MEKIKKTTGRKRQDYEGQQYGVSFKVSGAEVDVLKRLEKVFHTTSWGGICKTLIMTADVNVKPIRVREIEHKLFELREEIHDLEKEKEELEA